MICKCIYELTTPWTFSGSCIITRAQVSIDHLMDGGQCPLVSLFLQDYYRTLISEGILHIREKKKKSGAYEEDMVKCFFLIILAV